MVKKSAPLVNTPASFQETASALFTPVSHQELADALDCSIGAVRSALRDQASSAFRNPPAGWEVTLRKLLEDRADQFTKLAKRVIPPKG